MTCLPTPAATERTVLHPTLALGPAHCPNLWHRGMELKRGIAVSPGVAIGPALVLDTEGVVIAQRTIAPDRVPDEIRRLADALKLAAEEARASREALSARIDPAIAADIGSILGGHAILLEQDHRLREDVETQIRTQFFTAEYAVSRVVGALVRRVGEGGGAFARLAADFRDLEQQLVRILTGDRLDDSYTGEEAVIVLANDLTPSETARLPKSVQAFATESGGPTSHTAIMAGALEIPALVGIGKFLSDVSPGDLVIVDGDRGELVIDPDDATLARYRSAQRDSSGLSGVRIDISPTVPADTKDGVRIRLLGNIEFPKEAEHCLDRGAEGVGLYRTEFLYINKVTDPTEEEHFEAYREVLTAIGRDRPVVIRTLDIGADKFSSLSGLLTGEKNPFLGLRSVRLCLKNLVLFKTQLRAILRASVYGNLRVMFPMVSTVLELRQCRSLLREVQEDLEEAGIPFNSAIPVGTMIEVPSAALLADALAKEVDFFSIGTNDLVQYTLAADRNNENVAHLYHPADPAVLRLIRMVVAAGQAEKVEVNVCGEMSGETMYTPLLVGLGLRQLSATPRKLPEIKRVIRHLSIAEAEKIAREALRMETAREVGTFLREQLRRILPDAAD